MVLLKWKKDKKEEMLEQSVAHSLHVDDTKVIALTFAPFFRTTVST